MAEGAKTMATHSISLPARMASVGLELNASISSVISAGDNFAKQVSAVEITFASRADKGNVFNSESQSDNHLGSDANTGQSRREMPVIEISSDSDEDISKKVPVAQKRTKTTQKVTHEVIEILSSDADDDPPEPISPRKQKSLKKTRLYAPLYADDSEEEEAPPPEILSTTFRSTQKAPKRYRDVVVQDEAILVLDEPTGRAAKPVGLSKPYATPSSTPSSSPSKRVREKSPVKTPKPKQLSKKALAEAEFQRLKQFADEWFASLNAAVFDNKLPVTELIWNKKFVSTAGRAHYKRDRTGVVTCSIQLAPKILVSEDRIRNTLSHEMCHLACWILSGAPEEQHGSIFKGWGDAVVRARPEVEVTTKHNYEIEYPFNWKCTQCSRIYGRFSKSIQTESQGCGACDGARLVALFEVRRRAGPGTPRTARLAAERPRDSPVQLKKKVKAARPSLCGIAPCDEPMSDLETGDSDSDIEVIAHAFSAFKIKI
ncbi:SprT-like family-domain-containing protein [Mycena floridula]|nr:SprT-like family-domain-containing protein [Mycena floridula]